MNLLLRYNKVKEPVVKIVVFEGIYLKYFHVY